MRDTKGAVGGVIKGTVGWAIKGAAGRAIKGTVGRAVEGTVSGGMRKGFGLELDWFRLGFGRFSVVIWKDFR